MKFENFIKGPLSSAFGFIIMCVTAYLWFTHDLADWQGLLAEVSGFSLLFMRDKLPVFISEFCDAVITKYFKAKS